MLPSVLTASCSALVLSVLGTPLAAQSLAAGRLATTIPVNPSESIQTAIDAAANGDVILVSPGVYAENIDFKGKAISVIGTAGPDLTILEGGGPVVVFHSGEGPDSLLQGFTVRNGFTSAFEGGGISANSGSVVASPTVRDCFIRDNQAVLGGGGVSGNPTLERCVILDNLTSGGFDAVGGGVKGEPTMLSCVLARNLASSGYFGGGGLYADGTDATVQDCAFIENRAQGGAGVGGGISGPVAVSTSVFWKNTSGLSICPDGGGGGAMFNWSLTPGSVTNCTVVENATGGIGSGGIEGSFDIVNSIVRDNTSRFGTLANLGYISSVAYSNGNSPWGGTGNFPDDPRFVDGSGGDHHLLATSPCIDRGDPALLDPDGTRSDVGAFPFQRFYLQENSLDAMFEDPTWATLSLRTGGGQTLELLAGVDNAGNDYVVAGSLSGTSPGVTFMGTLIPLNLDAYTRLTLRSPNSGFFAGFRGSLDGSGRATASYAIPAALPLSLAGLAIQHLYVVFDASTGALKLVSNPVSGTLAL